MLICNKLGELKKIFSLFLIVLILSFTQCAKKGRPSGGPKDVDAPLFVTANPPYESINFDKDEIDIYFDERLKVAEDLSLWLHLVLRRKTLIRKYSIGLVCPSFGRYRTSGLSSSSTDMLKSLLSVYLELLRDKQIRFGDRIPVFLGLSIVVPRVFAITFYRMCRELLK